MSHQPNAGVRIGPVSLLTLVSVLLLAVLAMLCATTSNAALEMSKRQAATSTSSYSIESCGQAMLAVLDDTAHASGTDAASAVSGIGAQLDAIEQDAKANADTTDLDIDTSVDGTSVLFTVCARNGRKLDARVTFADDLSYSIDEWKVTTTQNDQADSDTLWAGSAAN